MERLCCLRMVLTKMLFSNGEHVQIEWFCLRIFALLSVEVRQTVERGRDIGMIRTQNPLPDLQCLLIEWFCLDILTSIRVKFCQVAKRGRDIGMIRTQGLLSKTQRTL